MLSVKPVTDNIHRRSASDQYSPAIGFTCERRYPSDFPYGLNLKPEFIATVAHDFMHGLFQITSAVANQEHIIHVSQVVRDIRNTLPAAQLIHVLYNVMVKALQIEIGEPLAGIRPDREPLRDSTYHLIDHCKNPIVLDHSAEHGL